MDNSNKYFTQRRASKYRKEKSVLKQIREKEKQNQNIMYLLLQQIKPAERQHIQYCSLHQNILTISVNTPLFLSRLRYQLPQLQKKLKRFPEFRALRQIRLKQYHSFSLSYAGLNRHHPLRHQLFQPRYSQRAAAIVAQSASEIKDPVLGKALKKLAASLQQKL